MTAEQMKYEFEVGYDRITNFDAPGYEPKEISTFLTKAQEEIIYDILDSSAFNERNRKSISMLRQLITLDTFSTGNYPNGFITPLQIYVGGDTLSFGPDRITDSDNRFIAAGFRKGDVITVTGASSSNNNKQYSVIEVEAGTLYLSSQTVPGSSPEAGVGGTLIVADPVLCVRNERADLLLLEGHEFYGKLPGGVSTVFDDILATEVEVITPQLTDVKVYPIDDDYYHANKSNPYRKPSEELIWRLDYSNSSSKLHEYILQEYVNIVTMYLHIDRKPRPIIVPDSGYIAGDGTIDGVYFVDFLTGLDCVLDPIIHREIVDKAVKLAYAALQDQTGYQISSMQEQQE